MADFKFRRINVRAFLALIILLTAGFFAFRLMADEPKVAATNKGLRGDVLKAADFLKGAGSVTDQSGNVTEQIVEVYNQEVVRLNQNIAGKNPSVAAIKLPDADYVEKMLQEPTNEELRIQEFTENDLKIIKNPTEREIDGYLESFFEAVAKNKKIFNVPYVTAVAKATDDKNNTDLKKHVEAAREIINDFLRLNVPEKLKFFHLKNLNIWQTRVEIGEAILNNESDPIKAIMAVNSVEILTNKENALMDAMNELVEYLEKNNG